MWIVSSDTVIGQRRWRTLGVLVETLQTIVVVESMWTTTRSSWKRVKIVTTKV